MRRRTTILSIVASAALAAVGLSGLVTHAHEGQPGFHLPGEVNLSDPAPGFGITYDWTVELRRGGKASLVGSVAAKSWDEPANPDNLEGSTAGVQWIAVDLVIPSRLVMVIERQQGAVFGSIGGATMARGELVPAVSFYRGWDETTETEEEAFDNDGEFWAAVQYIDHESNPRSTERLVFRTKLLTQGHYTLVVGGNPRELSSYPQDDCDPVDTRCYAYSGRHGYKLTIYAR